MTTPRSRALREALHAPLRLPYPVTQLGRALWLYVALLRIANDRGLAIRQVTRYAADLHVPESEIELWIARLAGAKLIEVLSLSPYLAIRLRFWSDENPSAVENTGLSAESGDSYSSNTAIALSSYSGEGGQGEGERLRTEIHEVLPDAGPVEIERILARYPRGVLRTALDRVNATPPEKIRKSKTALFRFLLATLSQQIDVHEL